MGEGGEWSCSISRSKTLQNNGVLMTVCKVSSMELGPIHQHGEHKRVPRCLHWPLLWNASWVDVAMSSLPVLCPCSAWTQSSFGFNWGCFFFFFSFYLSHIWTMPCERCKACDPFPIMWKCVGSRHWVKGVEEGCVSLRLVWCCCPSSSIVMEQISGHLRSDG